MFFERVEKDLMVDWMEITPLSAAVVVYVGCVITLFHFRPFLMFNRDQSPRPFVLGKNPTYAHFAVVSILIALAVYYAVSVSSVML
jgi:hypothetical protein